MFLKHKRCKLKKIHVVILIIIGVVLYLIIFKLENSDIIKPPVPLQPVTSSTNEIVNKDLFKDGEYKTKLLKQKVQRLERKFNKSRSIILNSKPMLIPNYNVHIFYYAWYKNPTFDGGYKHWNHEYLENWKKDDLREYPSGVHQPPNDIGSNYYPALDCYSSSDPDVIDAHLQYLSNSGIGVLVLSWTPPNFTDTPANILPTLFKTAMKYNIKISLHIEPYAGRNPINMLEYLRDFFNIYGDHPALYKIKKPLGRKMVPVVYVYDSYLIPAAAWREIFSNKGNLSVRGTALDAIYLGLLVELQHKSHIKKSQFDGFYTYFATNSFTYGSTWKNWPILSKFAVQNGLIFVPSVGPGYIDTRVRAWNAINMRPRNHGQYYDVAWRSAIKNHANYISITSFNEWHEGTQIEPAQSKSVPGFTYMDYEPDGPYFYLKLTKFWIEQFTKSIV